MTEFRRAGPKSYSRSTAPWLVRTECGSSSACVRSFQPSTGLPVAASMSVKSALSRLISCVSAVARMWKRALGSTSSATRPPLVSPLLRFLPAAAPSTSTQPPSWSWKAATRNAATSVLSGTLSTAFSVLPAPPPFVALAPTATLPESSEVSGSLVTYLITPPIAPAPYSVPCGPRSTSMWLRSSRAMSSAVAEPAANALLEP